MPYLKNGQTFRLADVYPDPWDAVQVVGEGETLDPWTWRTLCEWNVNPAELGEGEQWLIFWHEGAVAQTIRFTGDAGMPRFARGVDAEEAEILSRRNAVFKATLVRNQETAYYACVQESALTEV
ncbi:MAG TPA: hypothetical protein PLP25_00585 [Candidatus Limiplasma sp.]|nr:hypothetical protein [Candidatus Limiplasma sp.]HPS80339.1 hypothetical protein [Candidatus Limiplasma sp.]